MKLQRYIIAAAFVMAALLPATVQAKGAVAQRIHIFGFAASFNDTIVHFTNIQTIDSAWVDSKTNFLMGRQLYSTMLRDYLKFAEKTGGHTHHCLSAAFAMHDTFLRKGDMRLTDLAEYIK